MDEKARPAHYVVIHNGIGLGVTEVETITHNLSYLYERATKAVSYCTPTYYADLLCARGRLWLMKHLSTRGKPPGAKFDFADVDGQNLKMTAHFSTVNGKVLPVPFGSPSRIFGIMLIIINQIQPIDVLHLRKILIVRAQTTPPANICTERFSLSFILLSIRPSRQYLAKSKT